MRARPWLISLALVVLSVAWLSASGARYDGRTFLITAQGMSGPEWRELYSPLIGAGPWTYLPQAALFLLH